MGIAIPRPAMRAREDRIIRLKLQWHSLRTGELVVAGLDPKAASVQAMNEARKQNFAKLDRLLQAQKKEKTSCA